MREVNSNGVWPTPQQRLLLLAAAGNDAVAKAAWEAWARSVDLDTLEYASIQLLPWLYPRLQTWQISHPWLNRLRGIYRRTWYQNQLLLHHMADVLRRLHMTGVQTLLLNGPALVRQYYHDDGRRPMDDFDLLVPVSQVRAALNVLRAAGYGPGPSTGQSFKPSLLNARHAFPLTDASGHHLTLHWHALADDLRPDADADFWAAARLIRLDETPTLALNPADQLLLLLAQSVHWTPVPSLRWLADALVLLQATSDFDWSRLLDQTEQRRLVLPVRDGLIYLAEQLATPIPPAVLDRLQAMPVAWADRLAYQAQARSPAANSPLTRLWLHYRRYRRAAPTTPIYARPLGFTRFMRDTWGLDYTWQAPIYAVVQGATSLRQWLSR